MKKAILIILALSFTLTASAFADRGEHGKEQGKSEDQTVSTQDQTKTDDSAGKNSEQTSKESEKDQDKHKGKGKNKLKKYVFKGSVESLDLTANTVVVKVGKTERKLRQFANTSVQFNLTNAKIKVRDLNKDGKRDLNDFAVGGRVNLVALLPKKITADVKPPFDVFLVNYRPAKVEGQKKSDDDKKDETKTDDSSSQNNTTQDPPQPNPVNSTIG